jgi:hypothetical protein
MPGQAVVRGKHLGSVSARPVLALLARNALNGLRIMRCAYFLRRQSLESVAAAGAAVSAYLWKEFDIVIPRLLKSRFLESGCDSCLWYIDQASIEQDEAPANNPIPLST